MGIGAKTIINRGIIAVALWASVLLADFLGKYVWAALVLLFSLYAAREFIRLFHAQQIFPSNFLVRLMILIFIIAPMFLETRHIFISQGFLIAVSFTAVLLRMFLRGDFTNFADVSSSIWAIIYLGFFPSFYVWMRNLEHGFAFVIILVATISISDTAAMLVGKSIGRIPLSPQISPKKTLEGSLAGLIFGTATFYLLLETFGLGLNHDNLYYFLPTVKFDFVILCLLGCLLCVVGQMGDLLESLFKREAGVKDSGTIFDSHGGVLDRVDSHFFSAWIAFFIFYYLIA